MSALALVAAWMLLATGADDVPALLQQIERGGRPEIDQALARLQFLGVPSSAVDGLAQLARSIYPDKRQNAAYALSILHPDAAEPALLGLLADGDPVTRLCSCQGLRLMPPSLSNGKILSLQLKDPSAALRRECARTLGSWKATSEAPSLVMALRSEADPDARVAEIQALGLLGKSNAGAALEPLLKDRSEAVRYAVARSLCQIGDARGREFLQKALGQPDAFGRADAAEIVGQLQLPWVTDILVGLLKDAAATVVVRAARALANRNDPRGVEALVVRAEAATGDERAVYEDALAELGVNESKRLQILQTKHP